MKILLISLVHEIQEKPKCNFHNSYSKKAESVEVKDFHPISLVSGVYSIIPKVLANCMSLVVERII